MGSSDITSTSVTSGPARVTYNPMMILAFIAGLAGIYFLFKKTGKKRIKSGVGLINFSISPHNEKIAIGLGIIALGMYGLDLYFKHRENQKRKDSD